MMALHSVLCYKMSCRNPSLFLRSNKRNFSCNSLISQTVPKMTRIARHGLCRFNSNRQDLQLEDHQSSGWHSLGSSESSEDHQRSIESYLNKVESEIEQPNENLTQLKSLHTYLGSLPEDAKTSNKEQLASPTNTTSLAQDSFNKETPDGRVKAFVGSRRKRNKNLSTESIASSANDESSNLYLVSVLASIDIAAFLFEIASPIKDSDYNLNSLPLMYGAKVNELILVGEWWRFVTPMFLHSGAFHLALSSWVLLDFGPRVCKVYGSFTFLFVCLLGGISSNLMSFLHTTEPTVGGSEPVFSIIGAWLIYQLQNKDMIPKEISEKMFQKAAIATALNLGLVNFGLIDSWTYLSAALTGITYGYLTCPILQLDDPVSKPPREEGIALVRQSGNPWKSLDVFVLFVLVFSSLLSFIDPPLETPQLRKIS